MSARDTFVQLGFMLIAFGSALGAWALLTGPLGNFTGLGPDARRRRPKKQAAAAKREADPGT